MSRSAFRSIPRFWSAGWLACLSVAFATALVAMGCNRNLPSCPPGTTLKGTPPPDGSEVWCEKIAAGKPVKEGPFILYWPSGIKMIEGAYREGRQNGEWATWYENGQRSAADHFVNGVQQGPHIGWYANGVKSAEGQFKNGNKEGVWKRWDASGLRNWEEFYKNGIKINPPVSR